MQIACVLKGGPEYRPEHLYRMVDSLLEHNPWARVVCLTDCELDHPAVTAIALQHGWPGWWSKLELFRPGVITEPTLYLDIDTVVTGSIADVPIKEFTMLANVYRRGDVGSGVMGWTETPTHVYHRFQRDATRYMDEYRTAERWGDQAFIRDNLGFAPHTFGDQFRSYKAHCKRCVPPGTNIVYFHGNPRPWCVQLKYRK
jgi:hypothetical protein